MILRYSEILKIEGTARKAQKAIKDGAYCKIAHGLYSKKEDTVDSLSLILQKYKTITITMQTAFEYYGLTDYLSNQYYVATPAGSRMINDPTVKQSFVCDKYYGLGRVKVNDNGNEFYIYNLERMLIELMRNKNNLPFDYYKSVVQSYRRLTQEEKLDYSKVLEYLKHFKNKRQLQEKIMEIII